MNVMNISVDTIKDLAEKRIEDGTFRLSFEDASHITQKVILCADDIVITKCDVIPNQFETTIGPHIVTMQLRSNPDLNAGELWFCGDENIDPFPLDANEVGHLLDMSKVYPAVLGDLAPTG